MRRQRLDYGIVLGRIFAAAVGLAGFALAIIAFAAMARAHTAPTGWAYDVECCHVHDCAPVPDRAVREATGGYSVRLLPGDHPLVTTPLAAFLAHGSPALRVSGDDRRHVCVSQGRILCVYIPPGGV
jgi:hypothetical protein